MSAGEKKDEENILIKVDPLLGSSYKDYATTNDVKTFNGLNRGFETQRD